MLVLMLMKLLFIWEVTVCDRYPNCSHADKVMDRRFGLDRHCETGKVNSGCPYLQMGCKGCTFKERINLRRIASYMRLK